MIRKAFTFFDLRDMLALVGLALITAGVWQFSPPLALIVLGVLLLVLAVVSSLKGSPNADRSPGAPPGK